MHIETARVIAKAHSLNHSELAVAAGVSRQAVSLWFKTAKDGVASVKTEHLLNLGRSLGISLDELADPAPALDAQASARHFADLLWDRLYPDPISFAVAVCRWELRAVARLVEVHGLYSGARMAGPGVWKRFPEYKGFIKPGRRDGLERLWRYWNGRARN
jgi:transcriptional regulator with XRE-family HTH domain